MAIELIESTHTYKLDDRELRSVTTIMKDAGWPVWADQAALERGKHVHDMIKLWFDGKLKADQPDWLIGYLDGIKKFVAETGFTPIDWEQMVYDAVHGYAGRYDVRGRMRGKAMPVIIDFKTGDVDPWTAIQTAGYAATMKEIHHRMGVSLPGDGNYRCRPFEISTFPYHRQVFYACITVSNFKRSKAA